LDTGSSNPAFYEAVMEGLWEPQQLQSVWGGMKRHLNERVGRETNKKLDKLDQLQTTNDALNVMASLMMQQHLQQQQMSGCNNILSNSFSTAPMSSTSMTSSP
jgi:hypothetical protein